MNLLHRSPGICCQIWQMLASLLLSFKQDRVRLTTLSSSLHGWLVFHPTIPSCLPFFLLSPLPRIIIIPGVGSAFASTLFSLGDSIHFCTPVLLGGSLLQQVPHTPDPDTVLTDTVEAAEWMGPWGGAVWGTSWHCHLSVRKSCMHC